MKFGTDNCGCAMCFCVRFTRFRLAHSQYIRSFLAGLEYEDDEMKDAKKHAEHLDAAVNEIFEVKMLRICEQCLNNCRR